MARNPAAIPNPAAIAEQQAECFELKRKGLSVRAIAERVGLPRSTVQDRLDAAYAELVLPAANEVRLIEIERLDSWLARLEDQLDVSEDPERIVSVLLRLSERRAKLLGIDAPERIESSVVEISQEDVALAELEREAQVSAAVAEQQLLGGTK